MVVGELAVLVGKEEELGESGGCEERFHSQAKKRPGPAMLVADSSYLLSASFHFLDFALHNLLSYNGHFFSLLYLRKSY